MLGRFLKANPSRFSLQSDHHHLVLAKCDAAGQPIEIVCETELESLDEFSLMTILEKFPELKKAQLSLLLSDETCQWLQKSALEWQGDIAQLDIDQNVFYVSALQVEQNWQIALLEQASIEPYLAAAKILKLKWQCIAPLKAPKMNFLSCQSKQKKIQHRQKRIVIYSLPILAFACCFVFLEMKTASLKTLQHQNRHLRQELQQKNLNKSAVSINAILPVIQQLWPERQSLTILSFTDSDIVALSGQAIDMYHFNLFLSQLNALPAIQTGSVRDLQIQDQQGQQVWQLSFMRRAAS